MKLETYRSSLLVSLGLHCGLLLCMLWQPHHSQAVLEANEHAHLPEQMARAQQPAPIQAVAVDAKEIEAAMHKIEVQREHTRQLEVNHQRELAQATKRAEMAKLAEMRRLSELKKQAEALKAEQEKMKQDAALHLKKLAEQKRVEEQQLAAMQQKKLLEEKKLKALEKQQETEAAKKAQALAAAKRAQDMANQQRMAGEVDRYKALILNAIRDRWILPENVDPSLSSQFVIRLAPTGSVLEVRLTRSSGDSLLDRSAQAAIYKASPLPVPNEATAFNMFREISLTVRPSNARG